MDSFLRRTVKVTAREVWNMEIIMLLVSFFFNFFFFKFINFADETAHYMTGQKQTYIMKYSRYMTTAG